MNFSKDLVVEDEAVDVNVTSLVDIVFCLLLFFVVTTTFANALGINVNLPSAASGTVEPASKDITVSINAKEQIFLADTPVAVSALKTEFSRLLQQGSGPVLILRADEKVNHGLVVQVMDLAKEAGVQKLAIATTIE
ncbi:MAG TPA: biopolymer transporter ExbD [Oligoflexia bacterium]|nr:biopolymer transporter ExbD [Oligoflexia bacterium]